MATATTRSVGNVDLTIGLVTVPVKMVGVIDNHDRKGSMYHHHEDNSYGKVKMPKLCEDCGEAVGTTDISKGFEENGNMVMLSPDEMATIVSNTGPAVEVPRFVKTDSVDPMLFADENVYRLLPDVKRGRQATTTYLMIRRILTDEKLVGVVQYTRWGRNRIGLLDVESTDDGGVLIIRNMMWPDELRPAQPVAAGDESDLDPRLLPVMKSVVQSMTADWNPGDYVDVYTKALTEAIETKASGQQIATITAGTADTIDDVSDLLAKLTASIAAKEESAPVKKPRASRAKKVA